MNDKELLWSHYDDVELFLGMFIHTQSSYGITDSRDVKMICQMETECFLCFHMIKMCFYGKKKN